MTGSHENTLGKHNSLTYRSYKYDREINLYYLNSRYYNPEIGRFISSDGLLGPVGNILGHNMYSYTQNNPVIVSARNEPIALAAVSRICGIGGINGGHGDESGSTSNWFIDNTYGYINGVWEYNEGSGRFEWKLPYAKSGTSKIGVFEKFSIYNLQGAIGFGSNGNNIVGLKGVADFGTATGMLGVIINPQEGTWFIGGDIGVAVVTGRLGITIGNNIEVGVWGEALALKGSLGIGFYKGEFTYKAGASVLVGGGIYIRVKFW